MYSDGKPWSETHDKRVVFRYRDGMITKLMAHNSCSAWYRDFETFAQAKEYAKSGADEKVRYHQERIDEALDLRARIERMDDPDVDLTVLPYS